MWKPNSLLLLLVISLFVSASAASGGKPLVTAVTKDASTSLYTAPLDHGRPLVLDLSSPVISVTCPSGKKQQQPGTLTTTTLSANATDGRTPLFPVSFSAAASCAPPPPPSGAVGVAGLAPSAQSLPAQVARTQNVANKLALCLPSDGKTTSGDGVGVAILGGGPLFFIPPDPGDFTAMLDGTARLHAEHSGSSPGYYISGTGIAVQQARVPLPGGTGSGSKLVIGLSSTAPYTALRPDVYGPVVEAFDRAASGPEFPFMSRVAAVAPFERCYDSTKLPQSKLGYFVPQIDLELEGGDTFSVLGGNSMVQVDAGTACLGFVRMKVAGGGGEPAALILGGFQLENRLLVFDVEKGQLGFTTFLNAIGLSCSNFNFTLAA